MQILSEATPDGCDAVFRQSVRANLLSTVALACAAGGVATAGWSGLLPIPIAVVGGATLMGFTGVALAMARRSLTRENWLLGIHGDRLLLHIGSYLNEEPRSVVELRREDIEGSRMTQVVITGADAAGHSMRDQSLFLDIVLAPTVDTLPLVSALVSAHDAAPAEFRWRHHPVMLRDGRTLRLEWRGRHARIIPAVDEALRHLDAFGVRLPPRQERIDLGTPAGVPVNASDHEAARLLADQGRFIDAASLAARSATALRRRRR